MGKSYAWWDTTKFKFENNQMVGYRDNHDEKIWDPDYGGYEIDVEDLGRHEWVTWQRYTDDIDHQQTMLAYAEQRCIRLRGAMSYIEYLEGLLKANGIAIPPRQRAEAWNPDSGSGI